MPIVPKLWTLKEDGSYCGLERVSRQTCPAGVMQVTNFEVLQTFLLLRPPSTLLGQFQFWSSQELKTRIGISYVHYKNTEKNMKKFTEKNTEKFFCKIFRTFFCIFSIFKYEAHAAY